MQENDTETSCAAALLFRLRTGLRLFQINFYIYIENGKFSIAIHVTDVYNYIVRNIENNNSILQPKK